MEIVYLLVSKGSLDAPALGKKSYKELNGVWTFGDMFVEIEGSKLTLYRTSDDYDIYSVKIKPQEDGSYNITGWTYDCVIKARAEKNDEVFALEARVREKDKNHFRRVTMEKTTKEYVQSVSKEMDSLAFRQIEGDNSFDSAFVEGNKLYYIYLDNDNKDVGVILDRNGNAFSYNIYRFTGRLEALDYYYGIDESMGTLYEIGSIDSEVKKQVKWHKYYNNSFYYSVDIPLEDDLILRDIWDEHNYYGVTLEGGGSTYDYLREISFTIKASPFEATEYYETPFDMVCTTTNAGGSYPYGRLEIPGADEAYFVNYGDLEFRYVVAYIYKDDIEYEIGVYLESDLEDGFDGRETAKYEQYIKYMINSFSFDPCDESTYGLDKYEALAAKYIKSIYKDDIRNFHCLNTFEEEGKTYYHFMHFYDARVGVIVSEDLKCYDHLAYAFATELEEVTDY